MHNLLISPEQFTDQRKTAQKWRIVGIEFFINETNKIQMAPNTNIA